MPWIDFVVRRQEPHEMHVERIKRNESLWNNVMFPKLESFYMNALLPELASPREGLSPGIRVPDHLWVPKNAERELNIWKKSSIPPKRSSTKQKRGKPK